jgi:FKBP-type peptidyl-prolyl cis-trans isomerase FkpA
MHRHIIFGFLFCACSIGMHAQNKKTITPAKSPVYSKTDSGLEYLFIKDSVGGVYPEIGGYITFWFEIQTIQDSVIDNQFSVGNPVGIPTPKILYKASIEEGFSLLTEGDSAVFLLNADSLYANTFKRPLPDLLKPRSYVHMIVRMGKVYTKEFVDSVKAVQNQQNAEEFAVELETYKKDSIIIQEYLIKNKLRSVATIDGAYVVVLKENKKTQAYISPGDIVETTYVGKLLIEGTVFDKSPVGEYFKFTAGIGQVIKGWDQGFLKLKRGERAILLMPSRLAYGTRGAGNAIPPNAPLMFTVDIKK